MVSLQDVSSNGIYVNGVRIRKMSLLLMDGDTIQIASRSISMHHLPNDQYSIHASQSLNAFMFCLLHNGRIFLIQHQGQTRL